MNRETGFVDCKLSILFLLIPIKEIYNVEKNFTRICCKYGQCDIGTYIAEKDGKWKLYVHVGFQNEKIITDIINFEMQEQALAALNKLAKEKEVYGPIVGSANRLPDNLK